MYPVAMNTPSVGFKNKAVGAALKRAAEVQKEKMKVNELEQLMGNEFVKRAITHILNLEHSKSPFYH